MFWTSLGVPVCSHRTHRAFLKYEYTGCSICLLYASWKVCFQRPLKNGNIFKGCIYTEYSPSTLGLFLGMTLLLNQKWSGCTEWRTSGFFPCTYRVLTPNFWWNTVLVFSFSQRAFKTRNLGACVPIAMPIVVIKALAWRTALSPCPLRSSSRTRPLWEVAPELQEELLVWDVCSDVEQCSGLVPKFAFCSVAFSDWCRYSQSAVSEAVSSDGVWGGLIGFRLLSSGERWAALVWKKE